MEKITPSLQCKPREVRINKANNTWWEVGNDGEDYITDIDPHVFQRLVGREPGKGSCLIKSVRYGYEIYDKVKT
jgi:hypothetical protein